VNDSYRPKAGMNGHDKVTGALRKPLEA
jgi:hypothetical protein